MKQFYVATPDRVRSGPFDEESLRQWYRQGVYPPDSLVWTEGMAQWQTISSVFGPPPQASSPTGSLQRISGSPPFAGRYDSPASASGRYDTSAFDGPFKALAYAFRHVTFEGRATRMEFWMAELGILLLAVAMVVVFGLLSDLTGESDDSLGPVFAVLALIFIVAVYVVGFCLSVRRLHDVGMSGWWVLISLVPYVGALVLFVLYCLDSAHGSNEYGPSVKYPD